jgi:hypothetical protein
MPAPLEGIRVVELASFVAAPAAGALLVDLGAEVIKVEVPWGELYRHSLPRFAGYGSGFTLCRAPGLRRRGQTWQARAGRMEARLSPAEDPTWRAHSTPRPGSR